LIDDLAPIVRPKSATRKPKIQNGADTSDATQPAKPRFDDLHDDIGQPSGPLSLVRAGQGMQRAEFLLGQPAVMSNAGAVDRVTKVQKQVVDQLDQLIDELSKQCQGGQCPPGSQPPGDNQQSQAKPVNASNTAAKGNSAARDSTDRLNDGRPKPVAKADVDELAKQLWGHLPERTREQMMQSFSEEFLPKYEREIEEYYRRLGEEQSPDRVPQ
jgi:hypothetical protein